MVSYKAEMQGTQSKKRHHEYALQTKQNQNPIPDAMLKGGNLQQRKNKGKGK
jgi:hypothetical protein